MNLPDGVWSENDAYAIVSGEETQSAAICGFPGIAALIGAHGECVCVGSFDDMGEILRLAREDPRIFHRGPFKVAFKSVPNPGEFCDPREKMLAYAARLTEAIQLQQKLNPTIKLH